MKLFSAALLSMAVNAINLRQHSHAQSLAETMVQDLFTPVDYTATHSCDYVARRFRDDTYLSYADQCAASGNFVDHTFGGNDAINWSQGNSGGGDDHNSWLGKDWVSAQDSRISKAGTSYPRTLRGNSNTMDVEDIKQGSSGNCYFLASLQAIAIQSTNWFWDYTFSGID